MSDADDTISSLDDQWFDFFETLSLLAERKTSLRAQIEERLLAALNARWPEGGFVLAARDGDEGDFLIDATGLHVKLLFTGNEREMEFTASRVRKAPANREYLRTIVRARRRRRKGAKPGFRERRCCVS